jgi:acetyl-CoA carboxylase carboxyl transferase subunit alpha
MAAFILPFERPVVDLVDRVRALRELATTDSGFELELHHLEEKAGRLARELFADLTPMQRVMISRHQHRPYTLDYIDRIFTNWVELHGDRRFADDAAIVCGLARFHGRSVVVVGHQKGRGTKGNLVRNFGMPNPEGYRKAIRMYELAEKFRLPIITLIDTPGAYPGIGAEERGQSEAIAAALGTMARATVPIVGAITGEGGSGGALALGVVNRLLVLEFGCYSVISPEGCAAILWKDGTQGARAAEQLKITAPELYRLGIVDGVVPEPAGGAHRDHDQAARLLDEALYDTLASLDGLSPEALAQDRYDRFRKMGVVLSPEDAAQPVEEGSAVPH